jgi:hypothetical protein
MQFERLITSFKFYAFLECASVAKRMLLACFKHRTLALWNSILGAHLYTAEVLLKPLLNHFL